MALRRLYHVPRGSIGSDVYSFAASSTGGIPQPLLSVAVSGPSSWLPLTTGFEQAVHASVNTVHYYQNFNNNWPAAVISAITASGRSQIMTLDPCTASFTVAGGVRASDGTTIDNPMVAGTTYSAIVFVSGSLAGHVTQPSGAYLTLGGSSGGPNGLSLTMAVSSSISAGTKITVTPFTPSQNYTSAYVHDLLGIIAGNYDTVIQAYASNAADSGVAIRFAHEMNGNWYPWAAGQASAYGFSAAQYLSLWSHFRSVWQAQETTLGVAHLPWIWCPNISNNKGGTPAASGTVSSGSGTGSNYPIFAPASIGAAGTGNCYYPGDNNCEYIGLDGYSNPSTYLGSNPSFSALFANDLSWLRSNITAIKPIIIGETGVDASIGSANRSAWFSGMFNTLGNYSVIGVCYFNNVGSGNYPINTDAVACMGFLSSLKSWVQTYSL